MKFLKLKQLLESYSGMIPLCEGGVSGHLSHILDDHDLTFGEIKDLIKQIFSGEIELHEKTDGFQLSVTWKDGKIGAARNKTELKNPLDIQGMADKYSDPEKALTREAFVNSMKDVQSALRKTFSEEELNEFFNYGQNYMSFEVIHPGAQNMIDYGNRAIIQFHGFKKFDEKFNPIGEAKEPAKKLYDALKSHDALNQETFQIIGPQVLKLERDFSEDIPKFINKLDDIIKPEFNDDSTVGEYIENYWEKFILDNYPELEGSDVLEFMINRFSHYDKSTSKVKVMKLAKDIIEGDFSEFDSWFSETDKNVGKINKEVLIKLEEFILDIGSQLLTNLSGFLAVNPDETVQQIKSELDKAVEVIKQDDREHAKNTLDYNLRRLQAIENKIAPLEGVVFMVGDKPFKLTGSFAPLNQLIGFTRYGR